MSRLTILIPCHNGSFTIQNTLESIQGHRMIGLDDEIVILVVDSGSEPLHQTRTKEICRILSIQFVSFPNNLGYDRNILRATKLVETEFFWLLGDDDAATLDCFYDLKQFVDSPTSQILIFGTERLSTITKLETLTSPGSLTRITQLRNHLILDPVVGSAMSTCVWRRDLFLNCELDDYIGLDWIHFAAIYEQTILNPNCRIELANSSVIIGKNPTRWKSHFGSQYLAGLRQLQAVRISLTHGLNVNVYDAFFALRWLNNFSDTLTLCGNLSWSDRFLAIRMTKAFFGRKVRFWVADLPVLLVFSRFWPLIRILLSWPLVQRLKSVILSKTKVT